MPVTPKTQGDQDSKLLALFAESMTFGAPNWYRRISNDSMARGGMFTTLTAKTLTLSQTNLAALTVPAIQHDPTKSCQQDGF